MDIGEIFLGSFFQVLLDKLFSMGLNFAQQERTGALLRQCKGMLGTITAVLDDAEDKQLNGEPLAKQWLNDVKDLAYDMEDLLVELEIEVAQAKSDTESSTSRGQVKRKLFNFSRPQSLVCETKLQEIKGRFEDIVNKKALLSLRENVVDRSHYTNKRLPSTSLPEPQFLGREKEEAEILKLLTDEAENANSELSTISIIGMGGIGKTALAQRLYSDAKVSSCFERRAWVYVSDVFDLLDITRTILQSITEKSCEDKDLDRLQIKLKDSLSRKKFLVVLDDVWIEKSEHWTSLLKPFVEGAKGSKFIITTRNRNVCSIQATLRYFLEELSNGDCTSLLAYHALRAKNFERHPHLEILGKEIAKKCGGLPLAVKILGGLLRNKENPNEWKAILNNKVWDNKVWDVVRREKYEVLPALKLSYVHLPSILKKCFAYCAIFPKGYEFERDELALLWIVNGFLDGQEAKDILMSGQECFDELVSRSFFQQSSVNTSKFLMHDLLNDLAKSIADATYFISGESQVVNDKEKARHASFVSRYVTSESLRAYAGMKVLRSLILSIAGSYSFEKKNFISGKVLHNLLTDLKHLWVLSLCHCHIIEVPDCVGDLKYLRYLNLSYTDIRTLPKSIGTLCKLQVLILRNCQYLSMLPPDIANLVSLQFLDIRDTERLKEMPLNIGNLRNLIILSKFVVGPERGPQLNVLKNLPHLQGELLISELQNVEDVRDAIGAIRNQSLSNLILLWDKYFGDRRNYEREAHEAQVLHFLQPHIDLEKLTVSYYCGGIFPSWLGDPSYSNIVSLCLRDCPKVTSLPSLGQLPSLRELSLEGLRAVNTIGSEFYETRRPFPSLTTLKFKKMLAWKNWSLYVGDREEEVSFSCLRHLVVRRCPELMRTLPCRLDHQIKLDICLNDSINKVHFPSLCELEIGDCNNEILKWLGNLTSLTILKIENLAEFVCFDNGFMRYLVKLKELHITRCDKLTYLWRDGDETRNLTCLQELVIRSCNQLTSFTAGGGEIELPCNLERMELFDCRSLERLPSKMHALRHLDIGCCPKIMGLIIPPNDVGYNNTSSPLEYLQIACCDSWIFSPFAKDRLVALKTLIIFCCKGMESLEDIAVVEMLDSLTIRGCYNLGSLPQNLHTLAHLTCLSISGCRALEIEDFPPLPPTLSSLTLENCPKIKSIASCNIVNCNNLTSLEIKGLEIEEFPPLPITLSHLDLNNCPKMKSLPNEWHRLRSLRCLKISWCENIRRFPEGGLPPNLQTFYILRCNNMEQPASEWGLPFLTSLERVSIGGRSMGGEGDKELFPSVEDEEANAWSLLFPSSLIVLILTDMSKVERLSNGLRHHLSSLQALYILNCQMLRDLPEDGFPPSFHKLCMSGSSNLKDRFTGDYWHLIQEIPYIEINSVLIR